MKKITTILFLAFIFCFVNTSKAQDKTVDYCVLVTATTSKSPAAITLNWPNNGKALSYTISKKSKYETTWKSIKTGIAGTVTNYVDSDVTVGNEYEYQIVRSQTGGFTATGYLSCAIELPIVHKRGTVLLLIESSIKDSLTAEINEVSLDMAGDGWKVIHRYAHKDSSVQYVSGLIAEAKKWADNPLRAIYILGHVAVPYSGNYGQDNFYSVAPDGHTDHAGAWPADVWYGTDPKYYTDNLSNDLSTREPNKNFPGDGRFDQIEIPSEVMYHIGRVDLAKMPAFSQSEVALLKQYIKKAHDYRYGITKTINKGLIDENFGANAGAFASTGWRNFTAFFGAENVLDRVENGVDYFTDLADSNYLFAYGTGGGSFTSAGGIGTTVDFTTKRGAPFNFLFGSYFGDWNVSNNFLRAPLAAKENGLVSAWSGRPWWHAHHMALGETIGFSTWVSQSNKNTYASTPFANNIHIALMGDPTLRLYVIQPQGTVTAAAAADKKTTTINWSASTENNIDGYYVYRSSTPYGTFDLVNTMPITGTTLNDSAPFTGTNYYMVRTAKMQITPAGSFMNLSQGTFAKVDNMVGQTASTPALVKSEFVCYPNPTTGVLNIRFSQLDKGIDHIVVLNNIGQVVMQETINKGALQSSIQLDGLPKGLYWIKVGGSLSSVMLQ
jgi:hypothetical protein